VKGLFLFTYIKWEVQDTSWEVQDLNAYNEALAHVVYQKQFFLRKRGRLGFGGLILTLPVTLVSLHRLRRSKWSFDFIGGVEGTIFRFHCFFYFPYIRTKRWRGLGLVHKMN